MKKWFINKFPDLLAVILIGYGCYEAGYTKSRFDFMVNTETCANKVLDKVDKNTLSKFYEHDKNTDGNLWVHSQAYIEYTWATCFREEIDK